jgi:hypothetical protein
MTLDADREEIARFVNAMFMHADEGTFASLRTFTHNAGDPPFDITGVPINGAGLAPLIQIAFDKANRAARYQQKPLVFAPQPVAYHRPVGAGMQLNVLVHSKTRRHSLRPLLHAADNRFSLKGVCRPE